MERFTQCFPFLFFKTWRKNGFYNSENLLEAKSIHIRAKEDGKELCYYLTILTELLK